MKAKNNPLVVGCGGHARFVLGMLTDREIKAYGIIDLEDCYDHSEVVMGVPVVGSLSSIRHQHDVDCRDIFLAVGDNRLRREIFLELKNLGFIFPNLFHSSAVICSTAIIGSGNIIGPNVTIGAEVVLGNNNIVNSGAVIEHQSILGDHCHVSLASTVCGNVSVGDQVFLGANSTVVQNLLVSNETTLGAGATMVSSTKSPGLTLVGCPAKVMAQ